MSKLLIPFPIIQGIFISVSCESQEFPLTPNCSQVLTLDELVMDDGSRKADPSCNG